jgi:signal transduction histidine kinase
MIRSNRDTEQNTNSDLISADTSRWGMPSTGREIEAEELNISFVSMVSHEFRAPLTVIQSSTEILESFNERLTAEEKKAHFRKVYDSILNLSELLDDVIMFCRADVKAIKPKYEKLEIIEFSKELITEIKGTNSNAVKINFSASEDRLYVLTDKKLYTQIFSNLLSNAIKYNPENLKVDINISKSNGEFSLQVIDNGIGIPEQDKNKIFKPFFRAGNTREIPGSGLGLSIVQQSVGILNGEVDFVSAKSGTEFTVKIPVNGMTR